MAARKTDVAMKQMDNLGYGGGSGLPQSDLMSEQVEEMGGFGDDVPPPGINHLELCAGGLAGLTNLHGQKIGPTTCFDPYEERESQRFEEGAFNVANDHFSNPAVFEFIAHNELVPVTVVESLGKSKSALACGLMPILKPNQAPVTVMKMFQELETPIIMMVGGSAVCDPLNMY